MRDGYVKICAATPEVRVGDVDFNIASCEKVVREAVSRGAKVVALTELCVTSYSVDDLLRQPYLLDAAEHGLATFAANTAELDCIVMLGIPVALSGNLYNCSAVVCHGKLLGLVPKRNIPTYHEFYEGRHFLAGPLEVSSVDFAGFKGVPFGAAQLFRCETMPSLVLGTEICEDLWVPNPPSIELALNGATLICNISASNDIVAKADYRRDLVVGQSARIICAYTYSSAGMGESTDEIVFGAHNLIAENGALLAESGPFGSGFAISEVDVAMMRTERLQMSSYITSATPEEGGYHESAFELSVDETFLTRPIDPHPFVPDDDLERDQRCEHILDIQTFGLASRIKHIGCKKVLVGISGGLDSTLALLVSARAFDRLGLDRAGIIAVTMPGFGTSNRTMDNALKLAECLGCTTRTISIADAVLQHFKDIGHDPEVHDTTYENAQARERTQVLLDLANQEGGFVVGTGDLSELALGWCTFGGDSLSNYGVNAGVPKTLLEHLVLHEALIARDRLPIAEASEPAYDEELYSVLKDIIDTPVTPELLPAKVDGEFSQKTEEIIGPYELHDFFLYHMLRCGHRPRKVFRLACIAFEGTYEPSEILHWMRTFYSRFFSQAFKRNAMPDGPKVGTVGLSPRGDLRMASDGTARLWMDEVDAIEV